MSSNRGIVGAVPNSLLTKKSRSSSRSKSAKHNTGVAAASGTDQMSHSKSLAGNRGIMSRGGTTNNISGEQAPGMS